MLRVIPRYAMFYIVFLFFCVNLSHSAMSHGFSGGVVQNDTVIPFQGKDYIINETITVQDNVTLTVEPGVTLRFNENRSMIIHGALVANGTHSYPIIFRSLFDEMANVSYTTLLSGRNLRLVDGWSANAGRLEVFYGGAWGTVCDHSWNDVDSEVACKELGFTGGVFTRNFGPGSGQIWLEHVHCRGTELSLFECSHSGYGNDHCNHRNDVGLICSDPIPRRHIQIGPIFHAWHGIHFVSNTHSKPSSLLSYLVNVNLYNVGERDGRVQPAIASNGTFPYTENVTIANSTQAISASFKAFNGNKNRIDSIKIANCFYGIELKFDRHESPQMNTTIGFAYQMTRITINGCYEGITIYNPSTKDINLRKIKITNCIYGVQVTNSMFNRFTVSATHTKTKWLGVRFNSIPPSQLLSKSIDLCNSDTYFVTSPISVNISNSRRNCSMNFMTRYDHVVYVYIKSLVQVSSYYNGNLTIVDVKTLKTLFHTEVSKWNVHQIRLIGSVRNEITVQTTFYTGFDAELYIFDRPGFCPHGWISMNSVCYYYHGGAMEFKEALKMCQDKGSSLIKGSKEDNDELGKFRKLLKKRVFGKSNVTAVWIDDFSNKENTH